MTGTAASKAVSRIVAKAIAGSRKFGANEHENVMKKFAELRKAHPEFSDEIDERIITIGNRSAFSKDLAKAGLVTEGEPSAFVKEVGEMMDEVAREEKNALDSLVGGKSQ